MNTESLNIFKIKKHLKKHEFDAVLDLLQEIDLGNLTGYYYDLNLQLIDNPIGFSRTDFRLKLSTLIRLYEAQNINISNQPQQTGDEEKCLNKFRKEFIEHLVKDPYQAIKYMKEKLSGGSAKSTTFKVIQEEAKDLKRQYLKGTIETKDYQLNINSIRFRLMDLIVGLKAEDLNETNNTSKVKPSGQLQTPNILSPHS